MDMRPDIELTKIQIGGVNEYPVRTFWKPTCLRCRWSDEPHPREKEAESVAAIHLKLGCLVHYNT